MRFGKRSRNWAAAGRRFLGDRPGTAFASDAPEAGAVATEERDALFEAAPEEEAMTPPEEEQQVAVDPTQRLLTALGRFQRQVTRAEGGASQETWCDECMNQLITGIEIALDENWGDVREALTDTARILQTYENNGRAAACVPFLQDSYEILCLMVGDLIVDNVRSGVMQKWRKRYQGALSELEGMGLELVNDGGSEGTEADPQVADEAADEAFYHAIGGEKTGHDDLGDEETEDFGVAFQETSPFEVPQPDDEADDFPYSKEPPVEVTPDSVFAMDVEEEDAEKTGATPDTVESDNGESFDDLLESSAELKVAGGGEEEALDHAEANEAVEMEAASPFDEPLKPEDSEASDDGLAQGVIPSLSEEMTQTEERDPVDEQDAGIFAGETVDETMGETETWTEPAPEPEVVSEPPLPDVVSPEPVAPPAAPLEEVPEEGTPEALLYHAKSAFSRGDVADAKTMALELAARMADMEVDRAHEELNAAENRLAEADEAIAEAEDTVARAHERLNETEEQAGQRQNEFDGKRQEIDGLRGRLEEVQGVVADLDDQIRALTARRDEARGQAADIEGEIDSATMAESRLQSDIEANIQEEEHHRSDVTDAEARLADLRDQRVHLREAIAEAERALAARRESAEGIRGTIALVSGRATVPKESTVAEAHPEAHDANDETPEETPEAAQPENNEGEEEAGLF